MMVILQCSLVSTIPHLVNRTSKQMQCFWSSFLMLESYVSCNGLFVVGDLNVHLEKSSDPSTSALNVVVDNLSLHQLVKSPAWPHFRLADNKLCNWCTWSDCCWHVAIRPFCYFFCPVIEKTCQREKANHLTKYQSYWYAKAKVHNLLGSAT